MSTDTDTMLFQARECASAAFHFAHAASSDPGGAARVVGGAAGELAGDMGVADRLVGIVDRRGGGHGVGE